MLTVVTVFLGIYIDYLIGWRVRGGVVNYTMKPMTNAKQTADPSLQGWYTRSAQ